MDETFWTRFASTVVRREDRPALCAPGVIWSYGRLSEEAHRLARIILHYLPARDLTVPKEVDPLSYWEEHAEAVGVLVSFGPSVVTGALGTFLAGKIWTPLSALDSPIRLRFILEHLPARLLLVDRANQALASQVAPSDCTIVLIDEAPPKASDVVSFPAVSGNTPALVSYSSGSTGNPKGVVHTQSNLVEDLRVKADVHRTTSEDRIALFSWGTAQAANLAFMTLHAGASLHFYEARREGVGRLADWLRAERITVLILPPPLFRSLFAQLPPGSLFPDLRLVRLASETVHPQDIALVRQITVPSCVLINSLSSTETGTLSAFVLNSASPLPEVYVPIGQPVGDRQFMLENDDKSFPDDGRLIVRSRHLSLGYWRRPDLSRLSFRPDPDHPGFRLFYSADRLRKRSTGDYVYLGRGDAEVKIRGFRVDTAEVESVLLTHANVLSTVVLAVPGREGENLLVAFYTVRREPGPSVGHLREFLKDRLSEHMIPAAYVSVKEFPLLTGGKVDRLALVRDYLSTSASSNRSVAPRSEVEEKLLVVWQKVFRRSDLGIMDNFFELGGHSLLATTLLAEMEPIFRRRLPLARIFEAPTIASLVERCRQDDRTSGFQSLVPLQPLGSAPSIYFVHGWGGDMFFALDLARRLAPDRPLFGLRAVGLEGESPRHTTVETMASHYASEIERHVQNGPCHLLGYSLGCWNAYAVAVELKRRGIKVGLLGLIDGRLREGNYNWREWLGLKLIGWPRPDLVWKDRLHRLWTQAWSRILRRKSDSGVEILPVVHLRAGRPTRQELRREYYCDLAERYRAPLYPGEATVFIAEDTAFEKLRFWNRFVRGKICYVPIQGPHLSVLDPEYVQSFADRLRERLAEIESPAQ